jgi:hypothetical protein
MQGMMKHIASSDSLRVAHDGLGNGLLSVISEGLVGFMEDNPRYACPLVRLIFFYLDQHFASGLLLLGFVLGGLSLAHPAL